MNDPNGDAAWEQLVAKLEPLLRKLLAAQAARLHAHKPPIPQEPGLYLFEEDGRQLYIGQARKLRTRLTDHFEPSSGPYKADFAFLLARRPDPDRPAPAPVLTRASVSRKRRLGSSRRESLSEAKERVRRMQIRYLVEPDPELRTVFEVYATLKLNLPYNNFETH